MRKSDLRTGMRVTTRRGQIFVVLLNFSHEYDKETDVLVNPFGESSWNSLNNYNEDLTHRNYSGDDIVRVENPEHVYAIFKRDYRYKYSTIWERSKPKDMTLAEIEAILGYPVKIIKEDKP